MFDVSGRDVDPLMFIRILQGLTGLTGSPNLNSTGNPV